MKSPVQLGEKAFSLVEVVMALGVISFALVGMLGLLSVGFTAAKKSTNATNLAAISSQVVSTIRNNTNFTSLVMTNLASGPTNIYFDNSGQMQSALDAVKSRYQCEVRSRPVTAVTSLSGYTVLVMTVSYPVQATIVNRTKEVIFATVPR